MFQGLERDATDATALLVRHHRLLLQSSKFFELDAQQPIDCPRDWLTIRDRHTFERRENFGRQSSGDGYAVCDSGHVYVRTRVCTACPRVRAKA